MTTKDAHLYGLPRPSKFPPSTATHSSSAFGSALSSLISAPSAAPSKPQTKASDRPRNRNDISTSHNANAKKRAAADMLAPSTSTQQHSTSGGKLDETDWRRAKRKMDEKARLYAALKRGDVEDKSEKYGVDFDRKWAEQERVLGEGEEASEQSDDDDEDDDEDASMREIVEITDEFGRKRKTTRGEALREVRRAQRQTNAQHDLVEEYARPAMPSSVIYGDTIQSGAFQPEEDVAAQMAKIAAERDREATPPKDLHYDANSEIRTKGTGFYKFSGESEERKQQMEDLEKLRTETEQSRGEKMDEKDALKEKRLKDIEERKKLIREKKEKMQARRFLDQLGGEIASKGDTV